MRILRLATPLLASLVAVGCSGPEKEVVPKPQPEVKATPAPAPTGCEGQTSTPPVNGSSLWQDIPDSANPANCNFHRLAYNNFLYLVGGGPEPRFLTELQSTATLAASGWPTTPAPTLLAVRDIDNINAGFDPTENGQAGDGYELVDVNAQTVMYDIRINKVMWDSITTGGWNTSAGMAAAVAAYTANPSTGGVWLSPTSATDGDSIETKSSWRKFATAAECPSDIMFCVAGTDGATYGLLGLHLVQKTPTRGEWVWASFEHVSNSPDCQPGSSNPLQKEPRSPANPSTTLNVNKNIPALAGQTGWSAFNFSNYGGDGATCAVPNGTPNADGTACTGASGTPLCNTDPTDGAAFKAVNVCRTDAVPDHSTQAATALVCANTKDNANNVACLTQSVLNNWPQGLDARWKNYMLVGTEWLDATSVPDVGCVSMTNTAAGDNSFACAQPNPPVTPPLTYPSFTTTGTTSLANTTMETWMQEGTCMMSGGSVATSASDCFTCHKAATTSSSGDFSHTFSSIVSSAAKK